MFGMSGTELALVLILALLLLGPTKLPQLARSLGKGVREFKKATEDLRTTVEGEFYRMDQPPGSRAPPAPLAAGGAVPAELPKPGAAASATVESAAATPAGAPAVASPATPETTASAASVAAAPAPAAEPKPDAAQPPPTSPSPGSNGANS